MKHLIIILIALMGLRCYGQDVVGIEYSIDKFVAEGNGEWISFENPNSSIDTELQINVEGLSAGLHTLWLRSKNDDGSWSIPTVSSFYVSKPDLAKVSGIYYRVYNETYSGDWNYSQVDPQRKMVDTTVNVSTELLDLEQNYTIEFYAVNNQGLRGHSAFLTNLSLLTNTPPELLKVEESISLREEESASLDLTTLFTDADIPLGDSLAYEIMGAAPAGLEDFLSWTDHEILTISPEIGDEGRYDMSIKATDLAGTSVSIPVDVTVLPKQTSGLGELNELNYMVYPNPVSDVLYIERIAGEATSCELRLFNLQGQQIQAELIEGGFYSLSVSGYPKGIYLLEVTSGRQSMRKRIIIE